MCLYRCLAIFVVGDGGNRDGIDRTMKRKKRRCTKHNAHLERQSFSPCFIVEGTGPKHEAMRKSKVEDDEREQEQEQEQEQEEEEEEKEIPEWGCVSVLCPVRTEASRTF